MCESSQQWGIECADRRAEGRVQFCACAAIAEERKQGAVGVNACLEVSEREQRARGGVSGCWERGRHGDGSLRGRAIKVPTVGDANALREGASLGTGART